MSDETTNFLEELEMLQAMLAYMLRVMDMQFTFPSTPQMFEQLQDVALAAEENPDGSMTLRIASAAEVGEMMAAEAGGEVSSD